MGGAVGVKHVASEINCSRVFWRAPTRQAIKAANRCVPSLPSQNGSFLSEMRHDFLGKQRHRLLHKRGVHQPSLVEIADELVKTILGLQLLNPRDAVLGVAEYAHLPGHISIRHGARGAILAPATALLEQQQMLQGVLEGSDPWLLRSNGRMWPRSGHSPRITGQAQRVEIISAKEPRRRWSDPRRCLEELYFL